MAHSRDMVGWFSYAEAGHTLCTNIILLYKQLKHLDYELHWFLGTHFPWTPRDDFNEVPQNWYFWLQQPLWTDGHRDPISSWTLALQPPTWQRRKQQNILPSSSLGTPSMGEQTQREKPGGRAAQALKPVWTSFLGHMIRSLCKTGQLI